VQGYFLHVAGPIWVYPFFLGFWMALFTTFFAFGVLIKLRHGAYSSRRVWLTNMWYYNVAATFALLLSLGYFIGYRPDGGTWGIVVLAAVLLNVWVVYLLKPLEEPLLGRPESAPSAAPNACASRCRCFVWGFHLFLRGIAILCLGLMLGGCWTQAIGYRRFPPRGSFYTITHSSGHTQEVHAWCTGARNSSLPTFWFEVGGGGHSMSDLWGLQFALNNAGRRVCTYDYPGCAWSGYGIPNQPDVTAQLIEEMREPGPFILVGTMDGGPDRIYQYALEHPENSAALIPISWGANEWFGYQQYNQWSYDHIKNYAQAQVAGRRALGDVIRAIAVQWGIMPLFVPSSEFTPPNMQYESEFLNLFNEKQWTTQVQYLSDQVANPDTILTPDLWVTDTSLQSSIPVFVFANNVSVAQQCSDSQYPPDSDNCKILAQQNQLNINLNQAMASMTPGSRVIMCQDCQGQLSQNANIPWIVQHILQLVGGMEVNVNE
jgi:pimeloyl-ACP methyl ester carboxylesterase